jgi:hypothetical protein
MRKKMSSKGTPPLVEKEIFGGKDALVRNFFGFNVGD